MSSSVCPALSDAGDRSGSEWVLPKPEQGETVVVWPLALPSSVNFL